MKYKVLFIVILLILVVTLGFFNLNLIKENNDITKFNETIVKVSEIENISDEEYQGFSNKSNVGINESITALSNKQDSISQEIIMLNDLDKDITNQTIKYYVQLQIKRLTYENNTLNYLIKNINYYQDYLKYNDEKYVSNINQNMYELDDLNNQISESKTLTQTYLNDNMDLKNILLDSGVDEDFYSNEIEYPGIVSFSDDD